MATESEKLGVDNIDTFSLFEQEERMMRKTREMVSELDMVSAGVKELASAFQQGYREEMRLVRIGDRLQRDLQEANQILISQARDLQLLNERLAEEIVMREKLAAELRLIATIDELTGVHTRRSTMELAHHEERRWRRDRHALSVVMIDIDLFKQINDEFGHANGDMVLKSFAQLCKRLVRNVDIVGRMGGEEFLLVMPGSGMEYAYQVAERIRQALADEPVMISDHQWPLTASFGVAEIGDSDRDIERTIARADSALYEAKRLGRNRVIKSELDGV